MKTAEKFKIIDRAALKSKIDAKQSFQLWNVLNPEHYNAGKNIPGSRWVPVAELEKIVPALKLGKDAEIVVYCASFTCTASKNAAQKLVDQGFTNVSAYEGGLADWMEGGLPFVTLS